MGESEKLEAELMLTSEISVGQERLTIHAEKDLASSTPSGLLIHSGAGDFDGDGVTDGRALRRFDP